MGVAHAFRQSFIFQIHKNNRAANFSFYYKNNITLRKMSYENITFEQGDCKLLHRHPFF